MRDKKPCIFCGRLGNKSKEHFYPAWLSEHIDGTGIHNISTVLTQLGAAPKTLTSRSRRQGHLITKKLRVVCQICNNGWMSQIENSVKDILIAGLTGEHLDLSIDQQRNLVSWVCLKTIISEHSDPKLASTPFVDRHAFYTDRVVPDYFRMYLGAHSTSSVTWLYRHSVTVSFSQFVNPPLLDGLRRNTQTVTFILGRYVFHVLAARVAQFRLDKDLTYPGLTRLWPGDSNGIATGRLRALNASQLGLVAESFEQYMSLNNVRYANAVI
ncbi:MAG TPA: hypothetical protein VIT22_03165 [Pseudoxanthomonas sp.]